MKRLLERVVRRFPRGETNPDPVAHPTLAALEIGATTGSAAASGPVDSRESVIQALRHHLAEGSSGRLRADDIQEDAPMFDRGYLDSFSYVEFLAFIEHTYQVRIGDSQLAGHLSTIAAMADHILRVQTPRIR